MYCMVCMYVCTVYGRKSWRRGTGTGGRAGRRRERKGSFDYWKWKVAGSNLLYCIVSYYIVSFFIHLFIHLWSSLFPLDRFIGYSAALHLYCTFTGRKDMVSYRCWRRICIMLDRYGTIWYDVNNCTVSRYHIYCNCAVGLLWGGTGLYFGFRC